MSTRLDRLFALLESGSNAGTRKAAALQLGEVQKLHPHELKTLLTRILGLLRNASWDTRVAAGQALASVAENVPAWNPAPSIIKHDASVDFDVAPGKMQFALFDIERVLLHGAQLLGSEGREYDCDDQHTGNLSSRRNVLSEHMGLGTLAEKAGLGGFADELVEEDDFLPAHSPRENSARVALNAMWTSGQAMSARERNRYKRKLKTSVSRSLSMDDSSLDPEIEPGTKKPKSADDSPKSLTDNGETSNDEFLEWPFTRLLEELCGDLFNSDWKSRHGAATGIREMIRVHGYSVGFASDLSYEQVLAGDWETLSSALATVIAGRADVKQSPAPIYIMTQANARWLEDVALRLLCVLALDRFGDFVSYEVVAPVRESCAQALGAVVKWMPSHLVDQVVDCLLKLTQQTNWQTRHGAILGIKYVLVVKQNLVGELFPKVYSVVVGSLKDPIDDVCAVAAAALEAVMDEFLKVMPQEVPKVLALLWDGLLDFDDLTSWTNSFMSLLSTIITKSDPKEIASNQKPLHELLPRLWPFLDHSAEKIRSSVLHTVNTLVQTVGEDGEWLNVILMDMMKRLFQRSVLEERPAVHQTVNELWLSCLQHGAPAHLMDIFQQCGASWISLAMHPPAYPIDPAVLGVGASPGAIRVGPSDRVIYFAGNESFNDTTLNRDLAVTRTRILISKLISEMAARVTELDQTWTVGITLMSVMQYHFRSNSAVQKATMGLIMYHLAVEMPKHPSLQGLFDDSAMKFLIGCLEECIPYDELALTVTAMQSTCAALVQDLRMANATLDQNYSRPVLTMEHCQNLVSTVSEKALSGLNRKINKIPIIQKRNEAVSATTQAAAEYLKLSTRVRLTAAIALVALGYTPEKLAPLVKPLMDILKRDENKVLQELAAHSLAHLMMRICDTSQATCDKITKNLCSYLCCDPTHTPNPDDPMAGLRNGNGQSGDEESDVTRMKGILSLHVLTKDKERGNSSRTSAAGRKAGQTPSVPSPGVFINPEEVSSLETQRTGGECGLSAICRTFGLNIAENLPQLVHTRILNPLQRLLPLVEGDASPSPEGVQELINTLQILEKVMEPLHESVRGMFVDMLPNIAQGVSHELTAVRHMSARLIASMAVVCEEVVMKFIVEKVVELLGFADNQVARQGAIEVIGCVLDRLGMGIVPYIVLLTVPVMRRMTDQDQSVRLMASQCFGSMVRLMPLGLAAARQSTNTWYSRRPEELNFLEQLLDSRKMEEFVVPIPVEAQLRPYQQEGLNWLNFLNRYNLHGILCDDMGLGKTLQTICIVASDHYLRSAKFKETKSPSCNAIPSLVICPSTLIGHWAREVGRFVGKEHLSPLQYEGSPAERNKLRKAVKNHSLIISSYEIVKNDVDFFRDIQWNYCVLDEGHVIRNIRTRVFKAIKQLVCNHRLILSGTPVQNNVQDLWGLFDFLMPGLLGTEKKFSVRFAKPIDSSKDPKASSKDIEEGALAMETLHKQVLPFILRRLKSDVLKDLPPKIIQDYYCDLSPLQHRLYEDFAKSKAQKDVINTLLNEEATGKSNHVFQAFQYLRKVCNHPALVLNDKHPQYKQVLKDLQRDNSSLFDIQHAAKFVALQQLLLECGIGTEDAEQSVVNTHRALIFCQLTAVLEMLEQHLFRSHMPGVTYLKLDGSIPARDRQDVVERFNTDPSIDVLLLTTAIGGLGLNLTGADTVIFVEHDWNPSKDIQAMDRAHRIGQKRVVNVYRLITRGTLEEKIMGLQKFKLHVANSIITQENSALQTMGTEQIVDLFSMDADTGEWRGGKNTSSKVPVKGLKAALDNLEDLWDSSQYDTEYDVNRFMESLNKTA